MQSHGAPAANRAALGAASFMAPPPCSATIQKPGHAAATNEEPARLEVSQAETSAASFMARPLHLAVSRAKNRPTLPCPEPKPRRPSQAKHAVREVVDGRVAKAAASHHCSSHCAIRKCRAGGRRWRCRSRAKKSVQVREEASPWHPSRPLPPPFSATKPPVASWPRLRAGASPLECH